MTVKVYICDICGKEFGKQVSMYMAPIYNPTNFDSKFFVGAKTEVDICTSCLDKIAKAQQKEIEKIKKEIS